MYHVTSCFFVGAEILPGNLGSSPLLEISFCLVLIFVLCLSCARLDLNLDSCLCIYLAAASSSKFSYVENRAYRSRIIPLIVLLPPARNRALLPG
jgi:hypothetical protein